MTLDDKVALTNEHFNLAYKTFGELARSTLGSVITEASEANPQRPPYLLGLVVAVVWSPWPESADPAATVTLGEAQPSLGGALMPGGSLGSVADLMRVIGAAATGFADQSDQAQTKQ